MKRTIAMMAAALALAATQGSAQVGGGGSGSGSGQGSAGGEAGGPHTGAGAGGGATSGAAQDRAGPATQTPSPSSQATSAPPGQPSEVSGRVALVNTADGELAIDAGTTTTQVKVAPDAQITVDGKRSALKDIHQGAQVRASLERSDDGTQAKKIEVTSSAAKK